MVSAVRWAPRGLFRALRRPFASERSSPSDELFGAALVGGRVVRDGGAIPGVVPTPESASREGWSIFGSAKDDKNSSALFSRWRSTLGWSARQCMHGSGSDFAPCKWQDHDAALFATWPTTQGRRHNSGI